MALTKIAIIYSKAQSRRRRMIVSDRDDSDYDAHTNNLHPGEDIWFMPIEQYAKAASIEDNYERATFINNALAEHFGKPALSDRCIVVCPEGNVLHVVCADPEIDEHPAGKIIQHDYACSGWKLNNKIWIAPAETEIAIKVPERIKSITFYPDALTTSVSWGMFNTDWQIVCISNNLTIGCETHTIKEWSNFSAAEVGIMAEPNIQTAKWWQNNRDDIIAMTEEHQEKCSKTKIASAIE